LKTANLAIVFTDIQGFTERTSRQTLEQNEKLLRTHADLLKPLFLAFDGRVVKSIGDAFLAVFESPTRAVLSGVAIQDRLWEYNRTAPEAERLNVRVAINVGEVRLESNDVFGEPVNIASRVEQIAKAGEIYFTEAVYLAMNKAEVPSEEVGAFELKGVPGKIRVFKVPHAPYRVEAPVSAAEATGQPPFGNLGLSKVQLRPERLVAANLGQAAAAIGSAAGSALSNVSRNVSRLPALKKPPVIAGLALAVAALVLLPFVSCRTGLEKDLDALESAPEAERAQRMQGIQARIAEVKDPGDAAYYEGRLDEALGGPARATRSYRRGVEAGSSKAERRLVGMLEHKECRARQAAAQALGDLKLKSARGALEELAKAGGPGEEDIPLIGCNSKRAAEEALRDLE